MPGADTEQLPIVLCSGQLLTREYWTPLEARNPDRHFIHADNSRDDTIAAMATRLLADAPPLFHLVAHAMGGFLAFEVMRRAPERVASLSLLATLATADGPAQLARRQSYIDLVERGAFAQIVEERLPMLMAPDRRSGPIADAARRMAADTGPDIFQRQQRAIIGRIDSRPRLAAITVPTLILRGDADGIVIAGETAIIADGIAGSDAREIADAGHLLLLEQPEIVAGAIEAHLAAVER
ncbi:alpha/beta fold hydrolase [Sphingomonas crocodyli]|uniref:Alpha/beta fold hydrolase n=1 Tax=Sphingomonas crocodyli TaxID=1979270 RepID=A0A437M905_9SPHN|nr:alpha/beta fold hydrolase [Sphingomonas crocodyli]RVT94198.1 alpha/beta fold hydrolase [Sphingomonas crocodyli]